MLVGSTYGWAADPAGVPLTPDEIRAQELAKRDAEAAQSVLMSSMTNAFVQAIQGGNFLLPQAATPAPTLKEQLAALSAEERAELLADLAPAEKPKPASRRPPQSTRH